MLNAVIVDDEGHCIETLTMLLKDYCPNVDVVEKCRSAEAGLRAIREHKPNIVFLDIEMPGMNGFQLLEQLSDISFAVIFTTGYDQYALKAIRFSALDYLLKPVEAKELVAAVQKVSIHREPPLTEQFQLLVDYFQGSASRINKIAIPTLEGYEMVPAGELIRCEAKDNYTWLYLRDGEKIVACRTLKQIEEQLSHFKTFLRVHNSYIVNLNEIVRYVRGEGGYLTMSDGSVVNVSRSRKLALMNIL